MKQTTVLVVDDEEKNIKLLKAILSHESLDVVTASSGEAALQYTHERLPDLILLDVMMPGMNGFDVCRRLKKEARTQMIPVLMVTALKEQEDRVMALDAGADDFLSKPIDSTEILVRVKSLLRIKRYYDALMSKNEELQQKNVKLKELEKSKERLYQMIVHDLRSPLMGISGALEMLQAASKEPTQKQRQMVDISLQGCRRLTEMIDSILEVYRLENGSTKIRRETFDWMGLTKQIQPAFLVKAQAKGVRLSFSCEMADSRLCGDSSLLARVVSNLLDNAIRHTPDGGEISVLSKLDPQKKALWVSIKDTGDGIPKEYHQKIFERFEQHLETKGTSRSGTYGLGLAFCKMALEAHGGHIWVESEGKGAGSTFYFKLPMEVG